MKSEVSLNKPKRKVVFATRICNPSSADINLLAHYGRSSMVDSICIFMSHKMYTKDLTREQAIAKWHAAFTKRYPWLAKKVQFMDVKGPSPVKTLLDYCKDPKNMEGYTQVIAAQIPPEGEDKRYISLKSNKNPFKKIVEIKSLPEMMLEKGAEQIALEDRHKRQRLERSALLLHTYKALPKRVAFEPTMPPPLVNPNTPTLQEGGPASRTRSRKKMS